MGNTLGAVTFFLVGAVLGYLVMTQKIHFNANGNNNLNGANANAGGNTNSGWNSNIQQGTTGPNTIPGSSASGGVTTTPPNYSNMLGVFTGVMQA